MTLLMILSVTFEGHLGTINGFIVCIVSRKMQQSITTVGGHMWAIIISTVNLDREDCWARPVSDS